MSRNPPPDAVPADPAEPAPPAPIPPPASRGQAGEGGRGRRRRAGGGVPTPTPPGVNPPLQCMQCGARFQQRSDLEAHEREGHQPKAKAKGVEPSEPDDPQPDEPGEEAEERFGDRAPVEKETTTGAAGTRKKKPGRPEKTKGGDELV